MSQLLFKRLGVVSASTTLSRISGFVRDLIIAQFFGGSAESDAFFAALRIPNFLRNLFAEGALSQAFLPVLCEYQAQRRIDEVRDLIAHVSGALISVLIVIVVIGVIIAPAIVTLITPGFSSDAVKYEITVNIFRVTFPYLLFISLVALAGSILNAYGHFMVPALTPGLYNVCLISAVLWVAPVFDTPIMALAWGVFMAGIIQLVFQLPFLAALGTLVRPRLRYAHAGVTRMFKLMLPIAFGVSVHQVSLLISTVVASFLVTGSVSWLYYSSRIVGFPVGVIGVALMTTILPHLSHQNAIALPSAFSHTINWALRLVMLIAVPAAVGIGVLALPIITTLFRYGAFSVHDVDMVVSSMYPFSVGLVALIAAKILVTGFFSRQDTRTPIKIGIIAIISNLVFTLILVIPLAHVGVALAAAFAWFIQCGLLLRQLIVSGIYQPGSGWRKMIIRIIICNSILGVSLWFARGEPTTWFEAEATARVLRLGVLVGAGFILYVVSAFCLGIRPRDFLIPRVITP